MPRLYVGRPEPGDDLPYAESLRVDGWVSAPDLVRVEVFRAGEGPLPAVLLAPGDEVVASVGARARVFFRVLDLRTWVGGEHLVAVRAVTAAGLTATIVRRVVVDPARAWRRWDAVAARRRDPAPRVGAERSARGRAGPLPSVLVVATPEAAGDTGLFASVSRQAYPRVDLMACGEGDAPRSLGVALGRFLTGPWRLAVVVDAPGRLVPWALGDLVAAVERHEDPSAVYADDESDAAPGTDEPVVRLKPAWSPTRLAAGPYAGPVVAFSRLAVRRCLAATPAPPRDTHDLLLRLAADTDVRVAHVARPLFVRSPSPAATSRPAAPTVTVAVTAPAPAPVRLIVPTAYHGERLATLLRRLSPVADAVTVRIVDDGTHGSERTAALALCEEQGLRAEGVTAPAALSFNTSRAVNAGARGATGPLLLINDGVEPPQDGAWLARLLDRLEEPGVGVVGALLLYPDGPIQHIGVLAGGGSARHVGAGGPADWRGPGGLLAHSSERAAVTAACMAVDGALFARLGGFDEDLAIEYGDVDFCLRAGALGVRSVLEPTTVLVHHAQTLLGDAAHPADRNRFAARWTAALAAGDPFYHPGLDPRLDWEPLRGQAPPPVRSRLGLIGPPAATERPRPSAADGDPPTARGSSRSTGR